MDIVNFLLKEFSSLIATNQGIRIMLVLLIAMTIFAFYLSIFYFLFTHTSNPKLKSFFGLFIESLMKLIPDDIMDETKAEDKKKKKSNSN